MKAAEKASWNLLTEWNIFGFCQREKKLSECLSSSYEKKNYKYKLFSKLLV
jgi:hypothetical protein